MMFEFHPPDPALAKLLSPQKLRIDQAYILSPFAFLTQAEGELCCFNNLTKQGLVLPPDFDPKGRYTPAQIQADPDLETLLRGWFLKPAQRDETGLYEQVAAMMRALQAERKGMTAYTILPTTACNARCTYCYEADYAHVTMSRETARETLAYILRTRKPDCPLYFGWFGGEPLLGAETIDFLLRGLRDQGVEYYSGIVTNGSLITPALADRMVRDWKTVTAQITLDGGEEAYRRIKRYVALEDAYARVLKGIDLLSERGVFVSVRINLDGTNSGEVPILLEDLRRAVTHKDKVMVYLSPIFQLRETERCLDSWKEAFSFYGQITAAGFQIQDPVGLRTRFRSYRCMATKPASTLLITPEGKLGLCEHFIDGELYGNVREGVTRPEALRAFADASKTRDRCRDCVYLPDCSSFQSCPLFDYHCREMREMKAIPQVRAMLERARRGEETPQDPHREALAELIDEHL